MGFDKCLKKAKELHFEILPLHHQGMSSSTKRLPPGYRIAMSPSQPPPPTTPKIVVEDDSNGFDAGVTIDEIEDMNIRTSPKPPAGGPAPPSSGFKGLGNRPPPGFTPKGKAPITPAPPKLSRFMQAKRDLENTKLAKQRYWQSSRSGSRVGTGGAAGTEGVVNTANTLESPITPAPKRVKSEAEAFFGDSIEGFGTPIDISPIKEGDKNTSAALTADRTSTASVEKSPPVQSSAHEPSVPKIKLDIGTSMDISPLTSPSHSVSNTPRTGVALMYPTMSLGQPLVERGVDGKYRPTQMKFPKPSLSISPVADKDVEKDNTETASVGKEEWISAASSHIKKSTSTILTTEKEKEAEMDVTIKLDTDNLTDVLYEEEIQKQYEEYVDSSPVVSVAKEADADTSISITTPIDVGGNKDNKRREDVLMNTPEAKQQGDNMDFSFDDVYGGGNNSERESPTKGIIMTDNKMFAPPTTTPIVTSSVSTAASISETTAVDAMEEDKGENTDDFDHSHVYSSQEQNDEVEISFEAPLSREIRQQLLSAQSKTKPIESIVRDINIEKETVKETGKQTSLVSLEETMLMQQDEDDVSQTKSSIGSHRSVRFSNIDEYKPDNVNSTIQETEVTEVREEEDAFKTSLDMDTSGTGIDTDHFDLEAQSPTAKTRGDITLPIEKILTPVTAAMATPVGLLDSRVKPSPAASASPATPMMNTITSASLGVNRELFSTSAMPIIESPPPQHLSLSIETDDYQDESKHKMDAFDIEAQSPMSSITSPLPVMLHGETGSPIASASAAPSSGPIERRSKKILAKAIEHDLGELEGLEVGQTASVAIDINPIARADAMVDADASDKEGERKKKKKKRKKMKQTSEVMLL